MSLYYFKKIRGEYTYTFIYGDKGLVRVFKENQNLIPVGSIIHGRVNNIDRKMKVSFVNIGQDEDAFLIQKKKGLKASDDDFFNVRRLPDKEDSKPYTLDFNIVIEGESLDLTPNKDVIVDRRNDAIQKLGKEEFGYIIKRDSKSYEAELQELKLTYEKIQKEKNTLPIPKIINRARWESEKYISENKMEENDAYRFNTLDYERLLGRRILLASGVNILVDTTPNVTFFDINSGSYSVYSEKMKNRTAINYEAMEEILNLILLRNMEGVILVDILKVNSDNIYKMMESFKFKLFEAGLVFHDYTKLGLIELTREKQGRKTIHEDEIKSLFDL